MAANEFDLLSLQLLFHIRKNEFELARVLFQPILIALLALAVAGAGARLSRSVPAMLAVFALPPVLLLGVGSRELPEYMGLRSARRLAQTVQARMPAGAEVACYRCFPPGLPFYLKQNVSVITEDGSETTSNYVIFSLQKSSQWPLQMIRRDDAEKWLEAKQRPVFLLSRGTTPDVRMEDLVARRGATPRELTKGWWGALIPARGDG